MKEAQSMGDRFWESLLNCDEGKADVDDYLESLSVLIVAPLHHLYGELVDVTGFKGHWSEDYHFYKADALMCLFRNTLIVLDRLNLEAFDMRKQKEAKKQPEVEAGQEGQPA